MKILVAYNGSKAARAALQLAGQFAQVFHAELHVITSMEGGTGETPQDITKVKEDLKQARELMDPKGLTVETHQLVRGLSPGEDLVLFAKENGIDQIFVGIEKKSRTRKLLLGSTAQYVILKAHCPVITVK